MDFIGSVSWQNSNTVCLLVGAMAILSTLIHLQSMSHRLYLSQMQRTRWLKSLLNIAKIIIVNRLNAFTISSFLCTDSRWYRSSIALILQRYGSLTYTIKTQMDHCYYDTYWNRLYATTTGYLCTKRKKIKRKRNNITTTWLPLHSNPLSMC